MTTVAILPISDANRGKSYRAILDTTYSVGKTAGQALDALTTQLDEIEFSALLVIQSFCLDTFFSLEYLNCMKISERFLCQSFYSDRTSAA